MMRLASSKRPSIERKPALALAIRATASRWSPPPASRGSTYASPSITGVGPSRAASRAIARRRSPTRGRRPVGRARSGGLTDQDLARRGGLLEAGGHVDGVPVTSCCPRLGSPATISPVFQADPKSELDPVFGAEVFVEG